METVAKVISVVCMMGLCFRSVMSKRNRVPMCL